MCGISCIISKTANTNDLREQIEKMNQLAIHRGPDAEGTFYYKNLAFGHRRLSIIDLSEAATQPLNYSKYVIVFNGEIYNYKELKADLQAYGYHFSTESDTEIIPAAYDKWGVECLNRFNGMWSFVLLDTVNNKIFFSRDHFGIKPLYYYENEEIIVLSSEIKQLLALNSFKKQVNTHILNEFLEGRLNTTNETFFKNVKEIKGGEMGTVSLKDHQLYITRWYNLGAKIKNYSHLTYPEIVAKTTELFNESVKLRMRSDVRVGGCLSGGIDSSAIVTTIGGLNIKNSDFNTITTTYCDKDFDETIYSDKISNDLKIPNTKIYPSLESYYQSGLLQKLNYYQDQPLPSCSHFNEYEVFNEANQQKIKVMLGGQGADEYFLGYPEFERQLYIDHLKKGDLYSSFNSFYKFNNSKSIKRKITEVKNMVLTLRNNKIQKNKFGISLGKSCSDLCLEQMLTTSLPYQLHSEDRNSMMCSVESRLPFLDHNLVEFIVSIKPELRMKDGFKKSILRDAATFLPDYIKNRKDKMGFVAPEKIFVDSVRNHLPQIRQNLQKSKYINTKHINSNSTDNHLFRLVSAHEWLRAFEFI